MIERINVDELMFQGLNPFYGESTGGRPYEYFETFPSVHIPEQFGNEDEYLSFVMYEAAKRKYAESQNGTIGKRIEEELLLLKQKHLAGYILFIWDIISYGKETLDSPLFGSGNGNECCSVVNYLLGITAIDPIEYNLPFEKFVNGKTNHVPTIDIHIDSDSHEKFKILVIQRYGKRIARQIWPKQTTKNNTEIPEHILIHGLIIADMDVDFYIPVEERLNEKTNTIERYVVEHGRDLIGKGVVEQRIVLDKDLSLLKSLLCSPFGMMDKDSIPLDDEDTYRAIWNGEVDGVSYMSNSRFKDAAKKCCPNSISELAILIALSMPMRQKVLEEYVRRHVEKKAVNYFIPEMSSVLDETHGLLLYMEQLMLLTQIVSGMDGADIESMRKALMKRRREESMNTYEPLFVDGGRGNGYPEHLLKDLYQSFWKYAAYTFSKCHYICLATTAYKIIYLSRRMSKSAIISW